MAFLFKETKNLKYGEITYLKIAEKIKKYRENGTEYWSRRNIKTLGVLMNGRKPSSSEPSRNYITMKQAKLMLYEYNVRGDNPVSESCTPKTIQDLYHSFLPVYKKQKAMDYYNGLKITEPDRYSSYENFIQAVDNGKCMLSAPDILRQRLNHIMPLIGQVKLNSYDVDTSDLILEQLHVKNMTPVTMSKVFIEFKRLFKYAKSKKFITSIPDLPLIKIDKIVNIKVTDVYSEKDIEFLLENANEDQQFLIHIYLETGMRPEEGAYLSINPKSKTYCDLENKVIVIKSSNANKRGRTIPLSSHLNVLINNRIVCGLVRENGHINPYSLTYSRHSPTANQGRAFRRLCSRLEMSKKHPSNCLKMLRATVNTRLIKKNINRDLINQFLGEIDPKSTHINNGLINENMSTEGRNKHFGHSEKIGKDHYTGSLLDETRSILDS